MKAGTAVVAGLGALVVGVAGTFGVIWAMKRKDAKQPAPIQQGPVGGIVGAYNAPYQAPAPVVPPSTSSSGNSAADWVNAGLTAVNGLTQIAKQFGVLN